MKTRKNKRGGALIAEGAHGKALNVSSFEEDDIQTIYKNLKKDSDLIHSIELHTKNENSEAIINQSEVSEFLDFLKSQKTFIGKLFKQSYFDFYSSVKKLYKQEIDSMRNIMKYYKKDIDNYTTIRPLKYKYLDFIGMTIKYEKKEEYILFQTKCESYKNGMKIDILKMTEDILNSLIILQKHNKNHNDIKLNNIVKCGTNYKLIDWGSLMDNTFKEHIAGSSTTSSPIKNYLFGYTQFISKQIMYYATQKKYSDIFTNSLFKDLMIQINNDFDYVMKKGLSKKELIEKYAHSMDLFELGITVFHSVIRNKESFGKYKQLIDYLINLSNPPRSAVYALTFFKKFKHSLKE